MWYFRLQQRLAITTNEARALIVLLVFFFLGMAIQQWPRSAPYVEEDYAEVAAAFAAAAPDTSDAQALADSSTTAEEEIDVETKASEVQATVSGLLNINEASAAQLQQLHGIGPTLAQRIVEYREQAGGFSTVEELTRVSGIGPRTFEALQDEVAVE